MGDKIVKSKNLCCQPVVFPSLSLLNGWSLSTNLIWKIPEELGQWQRVADECGLGRTFFGDLARGVDASVSQVM